MLLGELKIISLADCLTSPLGHDECHSPRVSQGLANSRLQNALAGASPGLGAFSTGTVSSTGTVPVIGLCHNQSPLINSNWQFISTQGKCGKRQFKLKGMDLEETL